MEFIQTVSEYYANLVDILKQVGILFWDSSETIKNLTDIIVSFIGGVCAIKGIRLIKSLREKKLAATFTFWTQLCIKLKIMLNRLKTDPSVVNNLYSISVRELWTTVGAPPSAEMLTDFYNVVIDTFDFLKNSTDQIPAYIGWTSDYFELVSFLDDVVLYDITDEFSKFKFSENETIDDRNDYVLSLCRLIEKMISNIQKAQKKTEKKL